MTKHPLPCQRPLKIGLLSYRSNPHSGGQGIYLKNLARELVGLGHRVSLIIGPPGLSLLPDVPTYRILGLDLYNPNDPFRTPSLKELADPVNLMEWLGVITGGFPEPFTFGIRAYKHIFARTGEFDIIHDNQGLSYGVQSMHALLPLVTTIHHPISVDRAIAVRSASSFVRKVQQLRWHTFLRMQIRVARAFRSIITVSHNARNDIADQFKIDRGRLTVIPNGVDLALFRPMPAVSREKNRVMTINSADVPLKGLGYLLRAVASLKKKRNLRLIVVGTLKKNGSIKQLIRELGIGDCITFTGRLDDDSFVKEYARATMAVIPSVYEGFGLPAAEAMACGVPVISTTGGALPEVVGNAGVLVPPADHKALACAIDDLMENPERRAELGMAGLERATKQFSWRQTAKKTITVYKKAIDDHHRS